MIEKLKSWISESLLEMGAKYPNTNYVMSCMIIDRELSDSNFLPGVMPSLDRAIMAFPNFFGVDNKLILMQKIIVAQIIILNHRIKHHTENLSEKGMLVIERKSCHKQLKSTEYKLTSLEQELIKDSTEVWNWEEQTEPDETDCKKAI
jgi:hypothetical protein